MSLENHRDAVVRALERRFGRELAEDAVQDALEAALADPSAIQHPRAWLQVVAHRRAVDALRADREAPHAAPPEIGAACDTADVVETRERVRALLAGLRAIPGRQRDALVLRSLEARSYAEIAERLDVDPANAKQLVSRARRSLDAALTAEALDCVRVRELLECAVGRGARAPVVVRPHLRVCRDCARRHGELRRAARRRRLAALLPGPLFARLAEWGGRSLEIVAGTAAGGACAGACAAALLSSPAPVIQVARPEPPRPAPTATATPERTPRPARTPVRTAVATRTPAPPPTSALPAPTPRPVRTAIATPSPTPDASAQRAAARTSRDLAGCHRAQDEACAAAVLDRARARSRRFKAEQRARAAPPGAPAYRVPSAR